MNKERSGFAVMARLIGLVKTLTGRMVLAILMGLAGHLCAALVARCPCRLFLLPRR